MAKYPISIQDAIDDGKMSSAFWQLLTLHVPEKSSILDPTAGRRMLWGDNLQPSVLGQPYEVLFSDILGQDGNIQLNLHLTLEEHKEWYRSFDAVIYDPPYFIGQNDAKDPRTKDYGDYDYSEEDLKGFVKLTRTVIPDLLKPAGILIVKCADQYVVPERKFYCHHLTWLESMVQQFEIIDIMIYRHHRMSPTAFQVKDRPCCVIMHSYFLVGKKK